MIIACLGDSLTEGDYGVFGKSGIANVQPLNYPYFLSKILDAEVHNFGKCGFTSTLYLQYYKEGNADVKNADVILIMLGTNGGQSAAEDTQGNRDYHALVELCRQDAPHAKIILCTPPHATENPKWSNCGYMPNVRKAVDFVRMYAKEQNLSVIEAANCPDFTAENEDIMQPNDGLHFSEIGYKTLAAYIAKELLKIL